MNVTPVEFWGKSVNNTRRYDGMIELLQSGEIEIGATGLAILEPFLEVIDYAGETVIYE